MTKLEQEIQEDFNLFYKDKAKYQEKVDGISDMLQLTGDSKLRSDFLPTYIVGNYEDKNPKYVLFSLNPGFNEYSNSEEEKLKEGSLDNYKNFVLNFFKLVKTFKYKDENGKEKNWNSNYYNQIFPYISKLLNKQTDSKNKYDVYFDNLLNIDLIPYHSSTISIDSEVLKNNSKAQEYLKNRLNTILEFISGNQNIKGLIFNGKEYGELVSILYPETVKKTIKINDRIEINLFTINGVKCIQHRFMDQYTGRENKEKVAEEFLKYIES